MTAVVNRLAPCPDSPNCVSSLAGDAHYIEPLRFRGAAEEAKKRLVEVLRSLPRARIVEEKPGYVHAVFVSALFGFEDHAEFAFDGEAGLIHVRSAAKSGWWDFGVNRERMEKIRSIWDRRGGS